MVLLTQRAPGKEFGRGWEFPGGSAVAGETSRLAASRELREETSIPVAPGDLTLVGRFIETSALLDFYLAHAPSNFELHLQASEVMAAEWVTPAEVERLLEARTMAPPWSARLDAQWPETKTMISPAR
jgi:8-oxo-dGTP pyrophosphatase MutT (NUDIX family)